MAYRRLDGVMCEGGEVGRVCIFVILLVDEVVAVMFAKNGVILPFGQNCFVFRISRR